MGAHAVAGDYVTLVNNSDDYNHLAELAIRDVVGPALGEREVLLWCFDAVGHQLIRG